MREKVLRLLKNALPGVDFEGSANLVDDGILDSMAVTVIIAELTMEFGIDIPFDELESRNFNSVDAMVSLIGRCPKREETEIL
ncbi:MAG: acyl carrier protein [Synergistaceae bacterium]|nr:acyl carrier protein [Synergistaceae bacterium]